jgi:rubrerythrin
MSDKPSYLGLLNAIAVGEARAHVYFTEWASITDDPDVRRVLLTVAAREGEHGMTFAKRIDELGYEVRVREDAAAARQLEIARSSRSDLEKMEALGLHELDTGDAPDLFDTLFRDHSIDIRTGEMLGRYIAEERDTGRMLRQCHACLKAAVADGADSTESSGGATPGDSERLAAIEARVDAMGQALEELRQAVSVRP